MKTPMDTCGVSAAPALKRPSKPRFARFVGAIPAPFWPARCPLMSRVGCIAVCARLPEDLARILSPGGTFKFCMCRKLDASMSIGKGGHQLLRQEQQAAAAVFGETAAIHV